MERPLTQPSARRTQAQRRATSEQRLLRALAELIVEKGVRHVTLADIGRRAGCSHTLVVHLFGSKAAMLARLTDAVERFFVEWISRPRADRSGRQALIDVITSYQAFVHDPAAECRVNLVLWLESLVGDPQLAGWRRRWDQRLHTEIGELVRRGRDDGSIRADLAPDQLATLVVTVLRGTAIEALADPAPASDDRRRDQLALLDHLLRARIPRESED